MNLRVGIGYDIHRLVEERRLILGGIEIPYKKGLLGHSDADVLIHAVCDALLGGMGDKDIGEHFPETDPKYHNISSVELLKSVVGLIQAKNYRIGNIDTVVVAQEPALSPFKNQIKKNLAQICGIGMDEVNVKAKTNEGLGEIGRVEAIACFAVASLIREE
ncbi:MAG: 2-C-methyl-D-erythritol 2,4-cyclodiphosphate synthase [Omnitrophica WOR_2 bacterium SM23_72]|nr:MAG: 2-C-methyl-D-erythritol 2,4-cyclodiphosphate synthase [Omnitrophica WOR_2 bacterium SM23_72]